jgi:hypothetical protein
VSVPGTGPDFDDWQSVASPDRAMTLPFAYTAKPPALEMTCFECVVSMQ